MGLHRTLRAYAVIGALAEKTFQAALEKRNHSMSARAV